MRSTSAGLTVCMYPFVYTEILTLSQTLLYQLLFFHVFAYLCAISNLLVRKRFERLWIISSRYAASVERSCRMGRSFGQLLDFAWPLIGRGGRVSIQFDLEFMAMA